MKWQYWFQLFLGKYCPAQGLSPKTIVAYEGTLTRFRDWVSASRCGKDPEEITTDDLLDYIRHLRIERLNGDSAVNCQVVTLRSFYRAMVSLDVLTYSKNPTNRLPRIKAPKRKMRDVLSHEEVERLLNRPKGNTILGLRDRAMLTLLYGTGIRASECANLKESDVDFETKTIRVIGKGGHQRVVPLNESVVSALQLYMRARGEQEREHPFFRSRNKRSVSRTIVYERVRRLSRLAKIAKHVTPHMLRHTFATHLIRLGEKLPVLKELLGHRLITSTQVYLHLTGEELRGAVERHPVGKLLSSVESLLPLGKLRFQHPPGQRFAFNN